MLAVVIALLGSVGQQVGDLSETPLACLHTGARYSVTSEVLQFRGEALAGALAACQARIGPESTDIDAKALMDDLRRSISGVSWAAIPDASGAIQKLRVLDGFGLELEHRLQKGPEPLWVLHTPTFTATVMESSRGPRVTVERPVTVLDHRVASLLLPIPDREDHRNDWLSGPWSEGVGMGPGTYVRSYATGVRYVLRLDVGTLLPLTCRSESESLTTHTFLSFAPVDQTSGQLWIKEVITLRLTANVVWMRRCVVEAVDFLLERGDFVVPVPKGTLLFDQRSSSANYFKLMSADSSPNDVRNFIRIQD